MKGDAQPLIKFFDGSDKRFIIPLYQRNYDWKEENCEQLFHDLMKLHNSDRKSHFFGRIVSSIQSGTEDWFIIANQQQSTRNIHMASTFNRQLRQLHRQTSSIYDRFAEIYQVFWIQLVKKSHINSVCQKLFAFLHLI